MMPAKESHIARLLRLRTVIDAHASRHIDVRTLAAQFGVRPSTIRGDLNVIRGTGLYPGSDDELCRLVHSGNKMIGERDRPRLARLHAIIDASADGHVNIFALAVQLNVSLNTISRDLRLLRNFKLLPANDECETCELCRLQRICITHHWIDELGFHTKSLCHPCNVKLGQIFKGNYPTWEEQVKALNNQLMKVKGG